MSALDIVSLLQQDTGLQRSQIEQTVALLESGATVPFIARYRKEATGELDEVQIRLLRRKRVPIRSKLTLLLPLKNQVSGLKKGLISACVQLFAQTGSQRGRVRVGALGEIPDTPLPTSPRWGEELELSVNQ